MSFAQGEGVMDNIPSQRKVREVAMVDAKWTTLEELQSLTNAARSLLHARWIIEGEGK